MNAAKITLTPVEPTTEKKTVRKLTIEIVDQDAVLAAYPGVKKVVTQELIDRQKLRPIVNALYAVGGTVPGVRAYYAADEVAGEETEETSAA